MSIWRVLLAVLKTRVSYLRETGGINVVIYTAPHLVRISSKA